MRVIVLLALLAIQAGAHRMPLIEVRGERLTINEMIDRASLAEEEALRSEVRRRFTSHVRFVAIYGDTTGSRRRRDVIDEVSRVEEGPDPLTARSAPRGMDRCRG